MANLLPSAKINTTKLLGGSTKSSKNSTVDIKEESITVLKSDLSTIKDRVFQIRSLVENFTLLKKKESKTKRKEQEREKFENIEGKLEKKKEPKSDKIKMPSIPKLGFLDIIKRFVLNTLFGFIAVRLIDHLPKLIEVAKFLGGTLDFITDIGGKLLNGLATFVEKGYEAYDFTRNQLKSFGGEKAVKYFDGFTKALDGLFMAALAASFAFADRASEDANAPSGRRGFDRSGRRVGVNAQNRYARRYGRDKFLERFGKQNLKNIPKKSVLKYIRPFTKRLPIIGALLDFGLSVAMGEPLGRAAFKAIGAGLLGSIGAALGGPFAILTGIAGGAAGDWAGGALYDLFFGNKKSNNRGVAKAAGGGKPVTRGGKLVGGAPKRKIKKQAKRTIAIKPTEIKPGANVGGEKKLEKVFPKSSDKSKVSPLDYITSSYKNVSSAPFFGSIMGIAIKAISGQKPSKLDYNNAAQGLSNWMNVTFSDEILRTGALYAAGGGEINADLLERQGGDMTNAISKSLEESISKKVDDAINDLMKQMGLKSIETDVKEKAGQQPEDGGELETAGGAVDPSELYKEIGANLEQWNIFRNSIALIESKGSYSAMGGSGNHYDGRYQMGEAAKKDGSKIAGVPFPGHSGDPNAHVRVSFRNNPQQQETIFTGYTLANHRYLMRNPKYASASVERKLQILGYAHNQGMGGAENWLNTGIVGADGFGTKGTKYTDLIAKNFRAKRTGGRMELAEGAISIPTGMGVSQNGFPPLPPTNTIPGKQHYGALRPGGRRHAGVDFDAPDNGTFYSRIGGEVIYSANAGGGYGNVVDIYNRRLGVTERIAEGSINLVNVGKMISAGTPVQRGTHQTGVFHYEIRRGKATRSGSFEGTVDPMKFLSGSRFHGGFIPKDGKYDLHKGEFVVDKDSVDIFGKDFIATINSIENKSQLKQKAMSLMQTLSHIADYEMGGMQKIIIDQPKPEVAMVPMPIPIGGGGMIISGSDNYYSQDLLYSHA